MTTHRGQSERRGRLEGSPDLFLDNSPSGSTTGVELLTVAETAAFLSISKRGVGRLQQARQLPFIKVGGSVRFTRSDLLAYLTKHRVAPLDP